MEKENKKERWKKLLPCAIGAVIGMLAAFLGLAGEVEGIFVLLLSLLVSFYLHAIIHEGGHLVCGLLSGYKFVSFRIGSIIWVKQKDRVLRKRYNLPGTGGQCLLNPPEMGEDGAFPCLLYNLGGGLANLLFSAVAMAILLWKSEGVMIRAALMPFIVVGLYLAVINLLPIKINGIATDGHNIKSFRHSPQSARALWVQLRINKLQQCDGLRLSEIPEEFFRVPEDYVEGDPLMDALRLFNFQRLVDEKRFAQAQDYGKEFIRSKGILDIYRNMAKVDLLYLELVGSCRREEIEKLYTPQLKKYLKMVKGYPSTHRMLYAYAVNYACDDQMAMEAKTAFEKVIEKYPTVGDIRLEKDLMEEVKDESLRLS